MCLLVLAWRMHPRYALVVAANRDEFHERPAAALAKWPAPEQILAGRDLRAQGTWLALDRARRFGVVTNFRELQRPRADAPSRGGLIPQYLRCARAAHRSSSPRWPGKAAEYSGFNLLLADQGSLWYGSNRATPFARALAAGGPWPLQRIPGHPVAEAPARTPRLRGMAARCACGRPAPAVRTPGRPHPRQRRSQAAPHRPVAPVGARPLLALRTGS